VTAKSVSVTASAQKIVAATLQEFGGSLAVLTSFQREGVVIADLVMQADPSIPIMTIDTGRLPTGTLHMISEIEQRYKISVERILPDLFYFGLAQRRLCCHVRKVRPLAARMQSVRAYFTGIRRTQSESRGNAEFIDRSGAPIKISPLADWTSEDVARYTLEHGLPEHPLYAAGYTSIGCDPCTRAVEPGEDERAGRWWWEYDAVKECGLHFTPEGKVERTVDVLLRDVLTKAHA
jgi:phosphoadenosine phosphosulfate reductase